MSGGYIQEHRVVFDCNVYLDAARLVGAPFSWNAFDQLVAREVVQPNPHPRGAAYDSVRAIAVCLSGEFAGNMPLEVWTSDHIDDTVHYKARQSTTPDPDTGHRGLGWATGDADGLLDVLIGDTTSVSNGGSLGAQRTDGDPPLDHEDGLVYGACRALVADNPNAKVYCVTNDRGFLQAYADGRLPKHTIVISPARFVALVRAARASVAANAMSGRRR
ncbi:hypothetical protein ACRQ4C_05810 [Curtobacterium sp. SP.BCp]|uniref:hypothetical protein n=1 Tax=Curtobacterium sp. SP.BCp TaxID=3435230 RepID=UPI003F73E62F